MEIAHLSSNTLRIKGKRSTFMVDPAKISKADKEKVQYDGVLLLSDLNIDFSDFGDILIVRGPGEYEAGGIKMSAMRTEGDLIYNLNVDGVEILLGKLGAIEKMQHKLKDQHMVVTNAEAVTNASFISSLASNMILFYGEHAKEVAHSLGKEDIAAVSKISVTLEKLPSEVQTFILE